MPGPQGPAGNDGTDGVDGIDSVSLVAVQFAIPAQQVSVLVTLTEPPGNAWIVVGQVVAVQSAGSGGVAGYYEVQSLTGTDQATLFNLRDDTTGDYATNIDGVGNVAVGMKVSPGGVEGPAGIVPADALLAANNLDDLDDVPTALGNLGLGTAAVKNTGVANGTVPLVDAVAGLVNGEAVFATAAGVESKTAANARTALALVPGTNVQAYSAFLAGLVAAGPGAADRLAYLTAANTWALATLTAAMRSVLAASSNADALVALGRVKERSGLLGLLTVDLNGAVADQNLPVTFTRAIIRRVVLELASVNLTATPARFGIYTGSGKTGTAVVTDPFDPAALTATTKWIDVTLAAGVGTDVVVPDIANSRLYLWLSVAHGVAATAKLWIFGEDLS